MWLVFFDFPAKLRGRHVLNGSSGRGGIQSVSIYDVYIRDRENIVRIKESQAWNPDDAIGLLREEGDFIPETGDVVTRCVEVDRPPKCKKQN